MPDTIAARTDRLPNMRSPVPPPLEETHVHVCSCRNARVATYASRLQRTCTCVSDRGTPRGDHGAGNRSVGGRCQDAGPWGKTIVSAAPPSEAPQGSVEVVCVPEDQPPTAAVELTLASAAERPIPLPVPRNHQASGGC